MARSKNKPKLARSRRVRIYTLLTSLTSGGSSTGAAWGIGPLRTLQVRGDQSLEDVHRAIAAAFERPADYSYEFQFEAGPLHPEGRRYVVAGEFALDAAAGSPAVGCVTETTLDSLGLEAGQGFAYWPDSGGGWWHPIRVERIAVAVPRGRYPKVTRRSGASPFLSKAGDEGEGGPRAIGREEGADTACLVGEVHLSKAEYHRAVEAFTRAIDSQPTVDAFEGRARAYRALADADDREASRLRRE